MKARLTKGMLGICVLGALVAAAGSQAADRAAIGGYATTTAHVDPSGRWGGRHVGAIGRWGRPQMGTVGDHRPTR